MLFLLLHPVPPLVPPRLIHGSIPGLDNYNWCNDWSLARLIKLSIDPMMASSFVRMLHWMIDSFIVWSNNRLIFWLTDWYIDSWIEWSTYRWIHWTIDLFVDCSTDGLHDASVDRLIDRSIARLIDRTILNETVADVVCYALSRHLLSSV